MVLIGLTGTHGAGKGTVTKYLVEKNGFTAYSVSEFLANEARRRGMEPDRSARRNIANEYRSNGPTGLMEAVYATIDPISERVILEPQYTVDEVKFIQEQGGIVIAVDATLETRYERVHVRGSAKDDVSFEEFKAMQELEMDSTDPNKQNMKVAMACADIHLMNDGTVAEFEKKIKEVLVARGII